MNQQEGVIKFELQFRSAPARSAESLAEINGWRRILFLLRLIGRDPARYGGCGYGNISQRVEPFEAPAGARPFVVSGTQTGGLVELGAEHYPTVLRYDPDFNRVVAEGPTPPSSEALTHGALYDLDESLRFVMHVHSPEMWRRAGELSIPVTSPDAAYGTPEMVEEVRRLYRLPDVRKGRIIAMAGHEDGIVSFGTTAAEAGTVLVETLARAFEAGAGALT